MRFITGALWALAPGLPGAAADVNWEAVLVIGAICTVLGVLLYVPAHWWAKRRLRSAPSDSSARLHITSAGLACAALLVGLVVAGVLQLKFAPDSELSRFMATGIGLVVFFGALAVLGGVIGMILELFGLALFRRPGDGRE